MEMGGQCQRNIWVVLQEVELFFKLKHQALAMLLVGVALMFFISVEYLS